MPQSDAVSDLEVVDWLRKQEHEIFERFVANFYRLRLEWVVGVERRSTLRWNLRSEFRG